MAFAFAALAWAWLVGGATLCNWTVAAVGERIRLGSTYPASSLAPLADQARGVRHDRLCLVDALRGRAMMLGQLVAAADAGLDLAQFDLRVSQLETATQQLLACQPRDAWAWQTLYWASGTRHGFQPETQALLSFSYRTGPREAWVAIQRNRMAATGYDAFSPDLQAAVAQEWAYLVRHRLFDAAAATLVALPPERREDFFARRTEIPAAAYAAFGNHLEARGLEIALPDGPPARRRPFIP